MFLIMEPSDSNFCHAPKYAGRQCSWISLVNMKIRWNITSQHATTASVIHNSSLIIIRRRKIMYLIKRCQRNRNEFVNIHIHLQEKITCAVKCLCSNTDSKSNTGIYGSFIITMSRHLPSPFHFLSPSFVHPST